MGKLPTILLLCFGSTVATQNGTLFGISPFGPIIGVPVSPAPSRFWPGGRVAYQIDASFDSTDRATLAAAIADYHAKTCIRWVQANEAAHVVFIRNRAGSGCASTASCYTGGRTTATFETCVSREKMVHEMGHVLCFGHEQNRNDKAGWIYDCGTEKYEHLNFGHLYDYMSIMHYGCWSCIAPTREGVSLDQCESRDGLSILDAEKINDMYNCGGCQSYRFRFPHMLSGTTNVVLGGSEPSGEPYYVCRAFVKGEIVSGKSVVRGGVWSCWVPHGGSEYGVPNQEEFEVLTNPANVNLRWVAGGGGAVPGNAIASGRTANGEPVYVSRCRANINGQLVNIPGKVYKSRAGEAFYPYGGAEVKCTVFDVLVCG